MGRAAVFGSGQAGTGLQRSRKGAGHAGADDAAVAVDHARRDVRAGDRRERSRPALFDVPGRQRRDMDQRVRRRAALLPRPEGQRRLVARRTRVWHRRGRPPARGVRPAYGHTVPVVFAAAQLPVLGATAARVRGLPGQPLRYRRALRRADRANTAELHARTQRA